jgi:hypothetical protein
MTVPTWLDPVAKVSEIVGALVGVLALIREVLDKGKREAAPAPGLGASDPTPRGWLRLSAGLFCVPLLALVLQVGDYASSALRTGADAAAAVTGLAACLALAMHILSLRRQQLSLPDGLRTLLEAQLEESTKSHPYGYSLGNAPPILEIYVDQWTERLLPASMADGSTPVVLLTIAQMLEKSRNVIVLAEPGVGKSTAINQVLRQQCIWWRDARRTAKPHDAPYGPVIPITLPADLHGCQRLPDAMARQWEQLTGAKVNARVFGRKPPYAGSWLVLIDGVDQILSTPARTDLLVRVGAWVAETSAPYRFMITSRPLLSGELGPLKAEHVGRFLLRKFDAVGLDRFARQWVAFRESQHFEDVDIEPITVDRFMVGIKSAGLWSLARVPLIATITALILESSRETALPTSRAGLFERFVLHLFSSRHLENQQHSAPPPFAVHGKRGQRAWRWLLDNLRDLLEGVADLHLSVGSPGLSECAITWVRSNAPTGVFENVPGWDDAMSGLLTATSLIVPSPLGLQFAHPNFAEYLAAGPRGRVFDLETWLADVRSPDSRSLALFVLARQSYVAEVRPGEHLADRLVELLLERGGTEACIAGEVIADGIEVSPALQARVCGDLFEQLQRDAEEASETLSVLISLVGDTRVLDQLVRFAGDPAQPDWARADAAEELCGVVRDAGIGLLRQILESTRDSLLQHRILLRLEALGVMTAGEHARASRYESESLGLSMTSFGARAGHWYRQIAEDAAVGPGRRLRALLAMAERRDPGWAALFEVVITDRALPEEARLDAARRVMRLADEEGSEAIRQVAEQADVALEVRVPLLAAMAEAQDVRARQLLNQLDADGGPRFRERFPSVAAWREEVGIRSSEQPSELLAGQSAGSHATPAIWGNVPPRIKNFTGREDILHRLRQDISHGMTTILPPNALSGLGGVGKTAIAVEYAYRYRSDYDLVWWIQADQSALVRSSLAALASQLGLAEAMVTGIDGAATGALDALRRGEPYRRWLLIFDNADQPEDIMAFIPAGPGDILVTSRNHRWEAFTTDAVPVEVFTRAESMEFLSKRVPRGISDSETDLLADKLGDLPLALVQAGAILAETGMPVDEYLRLLDEQVTQILAQRTSPEYPRSVTAAWQISVAKLRQQVPQALELLRCCAFFGPDPIPRDIFRRGSHATVTGIGELLADPILLAQSIRELGRFALVRIEGRAISVHRLVQALLRDELDPDEQARYRHDAHLILAAGAPQDPDDVRQWPRYRELVPHVTAPAMQLGQCQDATVRAFTLDIVRFLYASGDPASSKALAEKLIGQWTSDSGPDDPAIINAQRHLGNALRQLGEYSEAWRITQITLSQAERILGEQDALTLALSNEFGAALRTRGDFAMALARDLETRDRCEAVLGADHPMTWHVTSSLVIDYGLNSDYRTARDLGQRVYHAQSESAAGVSPIEILTSWTNLAWVIRLSGSFREARDVAEDARDDSRSQLGPEHHATVRAALELSNALRQDASSREEALELSGEVFEICTQRFGESHPATLAAAVSLSNAQRTVGLTDLALVLAERTVTRYSDVYGPDHPFRHGCAGNLALLRRVSGDPAEARLLNETALAGLDGRLGRDNCLSLTVATNLASDLALLGDFAGARELGEDTLVRLRGLVGEDHPITLGCAANLTLDLRADGAVNNADKLAADSINRYSHTLGTDHPDAQAAAAGRRLDFDFDPPYI